MIGLHLDTGIHPIHGLLCRLYLRFSEVARRMDDLPLQIGELYPVAVGDTDVADAFPSLARRRAATIVSDIDSTTYTFTDLYPNTTYSIKVQAVDADSVPSAWSQAVVVVTKDTGTAVDATPTDETKAAVETPYFDISGRRLGASLPRRGLYIRGNRKVVVK